MHRIESLELELAAHAARRRPRPGHRGDAARRRAARAVGAHDAATAARRPRPARSRAGRRGSRARRPARARGAARGRRSPSRRRARDEREQADADAHPPIYRPSSACQAAGRRRRPVRAEPLTGSAPEAARRDQPPQPPGARGRRRAPPRPRGRGRRTAHRPPGRRARRASPPPELVELELLHEEAGTGEVARPAAQRPPAGTSRSSAGSPSGTVSRAGSRRGPAHASVPGARLSIAPPRSAGPSIP